VQNAADVNSRSEFVEYVRLVSASLAQVPCENSLTSDYLEALSGWVEDMDGYFKNAGTQEDQYSKWSLMAQIVTAALNYE
jgi:hypothetical protein